MIRTALPTLALATPFAAQVMHAADLVVHVDNVKSTSGQVMVALYGNADAFLKHPVRAEQAKADKAGTTLVFHDARGRGAPVALARLPYRTPHCFHGNFQAA